jgi:hypothetical protein
LTLGKPEIFIESVNMSPAGQDTFGEISSGRITLKGYLRTMKAYLDGQLLTLLDDNERGKTKDERL